jgi:hypothetical protein
LVAGLAGLGLPVADGHDHPVSTLRFPDGGQYRVEIAGVERASSMEAMVKEAGRRGVPVHRVIGMVGGATYLEDAELRDYAQVAAANRIEVIVTPGPRRFWDTGRQITTPEGLVSGMRVRGVDNLRNLLLDIERCIDAGFRGFLVADEGVLWILNGLRERGVIPKNVIFKVSVFAGHGHPGGARLLESMGAGSFNPLADLSLAMLASLRRTVKIPLDVYVILVNAMGGFNRFYEAPEIARVTSPCYFKFEPGPSEDAIYAPWNSEDYHRDLVREKVRYAAIVTEIIQRLAPDVVASGAGASDLAVPEV